MALIDRLRNAIRGLAGGTDATPKPLVEAPVDPPEPPSAASGDGHAPGHRHLGPPPEQPMPPGAEKKSPSNQPWVRTSQSDSQQRRPRG